MNTRNTLKAVALASVCLAPLAAVAQDFDADAAPAATAQAPAYDNEIELGLRGSSAGGNGQFGRYNGQISPGITGTAGWAITGRDDPKSGSTRYFNFTGKDVDFKNTSEYLPESSVSFKIGDQGLWGAKLNYDAITYTRSTNFHTANDLNGNLVNGLTPQTPGTNAIINVGRFENTDTVGTRRDIGGLNLKGRLDDWSISSSFQHEHKEGSLESSLLYGGTGKTVNSTVDAINYFPVPVNYDTDRFEVKGAFTSPRLQAELAYDASRFVDQSNVLMLQNPLAQAAAGKASYFALPPSNWSNQVKGSAGYDIDATTRVIGTAALALETRDDGAEFNDSGTNGAASTGNLSSGARARTIFANLSGVSRPLSRLELKGGYTYDARQDLRPLQRIASVLADSGSGTTTYISIPESWAKQTVKLSAGYKILPSTKVELDYAYKDVHRQNAESLKSDENTIGASVRSDLGGGFSGSIGAEHSNRNGSVSLNPLWESSANATSPFYEASLVADSVTSDLHYSPVDAVSVGFNAKYAHDNYPSTQDGMTNDYTLTAGPDLDVRLNDNLATHFFYNYERIYQNYAGGAAANPSQTSERSLDANQTAGASLDWKATDKLKVAANYTFQYGTTTYDYFLNAAAAASTTTPFIAAGAGGVPMVSQVMHALSLTGEYELSPGLALWSGYSYQRLSVADFGNNFATTTYSNFQLPGDYNPNYNVHTVAAKVKFKW